MAFKRVSRGFLFLYDFLTFNNLLKEIKKNAPISKFSGGCCVMGLTRI